MTNFHALNQASILSSQGQKPLNLDIKPTHAANTNKEDGFFLTGVNLGQQKAEKALKSGLEDLEVVSVVDSVKALNTEQAVMISEQDKSVV